MEYRDAVKIAMDQMSRSFGYQYTPKAEIEERIARLRTGMRKGGIEAALIIQKMDGYYFSGTTQDSLLFVPLDGAPLLLVKREIERARMETPLGKVVEFTSMQTLPDLIHEHWGRLPESIGLEFDMLPVRNYFKIQKLFPKARFLDTARMVRHIRMIKSPFEIGLMRKSGDIGRSVFLKAREILREGMSEIEFGGLMEAAAKKYGHEGLLRVRSINYEAYTWHILSGPSGGIVSQSDSPMGGLGLSPAFPVGASLKKIEKNEPVLVDFGTCYHGYQVDETRMFSIGPMKKKFIDAYAACREIHDTVLADVRPGADCDSLYRKTVQLAEELGYGQSYLGPPGLQTRFVGHGVGLELGEPPFIALGQSYPLEAGMTFALEPKIVFPGEGAVGIENTVLVTEGGFEILTPLAKDIFQI